MPRKTERYVAVQLSVREQKAAAGALNEAAAAAPAGSRFREWARDIATKIRRARETPCPK